MSSANAGLVFDWAKGLDLIMVRDMNTTRRNKGPWTHLVMVYFFTVLFGALVYWLLGFVVRDIAAWLGPNYGEVEKRLLDPQQFLQALVDLA